MIDTLKDELHALHTAPPRNDPGHYAGPLALAFGLAALALLLGPGYHGGFGTINSLATWLPPQAWSLMTFSGDALFAASLSLLFARRYPDLVWQLVLATLLATLLVRLGKSTLDLPRPPGVLDAARFHLIGPAWSYHSFPSGHSATLLSFACVWSAYLARPWRLLLLALATALAGTRVIVGVHWPVDVLAGAAAGAFSAWAAIRLSRQWRWGLTLAGHGFGLFLLCGCAATMLFYAGGYTAPRVPAALFAAFVLLYAARDYGLPRLIASMWTDRSAAT